MLVDGSSVQAHEGIQQMVVTKYGQPRDEQASSYAISYAVSHALRVRGHGCDVSWQCYSEAARSLDGLLVDDGADCRVSYMPCRKLAPRKHSSSYRSCRCVYSHVS